MTDLETMKRLKALHAHMDSHIVVLQTDEMTIFSDGSVQMVVNGAQVRFKPSEIQNVFASMMEQMSKLGTIRAAREMLAERAEVLIESQDDESEVNSIEATRFLQAAIDSWQRVWCGFNN